MIYINTKFGWYSTGETDITRIPQKWKMYARSYYDTSNNDFVHPGPMGYYRSRGFRLSAGVKLIMWMDPEAAFPLFRETQYLDKRAEVIARWNNKCKALLL